MGFKYLAAVTAFTMQVCALSASAPVQPAEAADTPTQQTVEQVMKGNWDKSATATNPRSALTLNSVKFGKPYKATLQEVQVEGIPQNAMVTPAVVDFTVRNYHSNQTQAVRRVREARVYKDKMNEWAVKTGSVKGQDVTTKEAAVK
jgi:hypothetical protein